MLGIKRQLGVRSTIGAGMRVNGDCSFQDGLQIDGTVLGNVTAESGQPSVLVIGEAGRVEGAISADHVVIGGTVIGPVLAREALELQSKAQVQGDVRYKSLEMQQGAVIAGQLQPQMTPPPAEAMPAAPAAVVEPTLREPTLDPDRH
ncbi:MAG: polymer-forming cytoskeletal protein [Burkholderiales bacterium]|nr:polymer-forming cytoskeletal protein [Burkholderiales bacterium]MBK8664616.1 polymer-forming cytoskeletal protein [Burkholderiales bacterium]